MKDHFLSGFLPGLVAPLTGFYIYYLLMFSYIGFSSFLNHIIKNNLIIEVISIGVILNLGLFMLFYRVEKDRAAKGVLGATFIYAFIVAWFKMN